jgi:hypothetical protein
MQTTPQPNKIKAEIPVAFRELFDPHRYKIFHGGRGGGKSWAFAMALLLLAYRKRLTVLCAREIQNSIEDSVHKLLSLQVKALGLSDFYEIQKTKIIGQNGSEFIFAGLFRNVNKIKSAEDIDICWVEEAASVSEDSWIDLIPTIRKEGSEIWISFNPDNEDDPTYLRYVTNPPATAIVRQANYCDNPYFTKTLRLEMESDKAFRPLQYEHIWLGKPLGLGRKIWEQYIDESWPNGHLRSFDWSMVKDRANCFVVQDPAQHYYPACIAVAMIPKNDKGDNFNHWVYAEWPTFDTFNDYFYNIRTKVLYTGTLSDMAKQIYIMSGSAEHGLKISKHGIDTRFVKGTGSQNYWSNDTAGLVQAFARPENGGIVFDCPEEKLIDAAKNNINSWLQWNTKMERMSLYNEPSFYVAPWCRNMRDSMKNHRLLDDKETENPKRKDFSDCAKIYNALIADWRYKDPRKKQEPFKPHEMAMSGNTGWMV